MDHPLKSQSIGIGSDDMANVYELNHRKIFARPEFDNPSSSQETKFLPTKLRSKISECVDDKSKTEQRSGMTVLGARHRKAVAPRTTVTDKLDQKKDDLIDEIPCGDILTQEDPVETAAEMCVSLRLPEQNWNWELTTTLQNVGETDFDEDKESMEISCCDLLKNVPSESYYFGQTIFGTPNAAEQLARDSTKPSLQTGYHGVFTDRNYEFLSQKNSTQMNVPIGRSSHGSVYLIKHDVITYVKKRVSSGFRPSEVICMLKLAHQNVVKMGAFLMHDGIPEIIMEFAGISLHQYARENKLQENEIWNFVTQLFKGLVYLDTESIIHMDIKPENLFVSTNENGMCLKIGDFGSAKLPGDDAEMEGMTPEYLPPEVCRLFLLKHYPMLITGGAQFRGEELTISSKCDVYQAGLVVMFMYKKHHVLLHHFRLTNPQLETNILRLRMMKGIAENEDLAKNLIPPEVGKLMKCVLQNMLHGNTNKRFTAPRILDLLQVLSESAVRGMTEQRREENKMTPEVEVPREKAIHGRRKKTKTPKPEVKTQPKEEVMDHSMSIMNEKILHEPPQLKKRMVKQVLKRRIIDKREEIPHKIIKASTSGTNSMLSSPSIQENESVMSQPGATCGISMEIPVDYMRAYAAPVQAQDNVNVYRAVQETNDQMDCEGPGNIPNLDLFEGLELSK